MRLTKIKRWIMGVYAVLAAILVVIDDTSPTVYTKVRFFIILLLYFYLPLTVVFWIIKAFLHRFMKMKTALDAKQVTGSFVAANEFIRFYAINNLESFELKLYSFAVKNPNQVFILHDPLHQGAFIDLTGKQLQHQLNQIKAGLIGRDDQARRSVTPRGWNEVKRSYVDEQTGLSHYNYHRTHLVPFNMCLSEGAEDPLLLITATSKLNSGDELFKTSRRTPEDVYEKGLMIKKMIISESFIRPVDIRHVIHDVKGSTKRLYGDGRYIEPVEIDVSMADIEMACRLYMTDPSYARHLFRYGVVCDYETTAAEKTGVPSGVSILFMDLSKKKILLRAYLGNQ